MARHIDCQNASILAAREKYTGYYTSNNLSLTDVLRIQQPADNYRQTYAENDISVVVL